MSQGWSIRRQAGAVFVQCKALELPGIAHAFGTRDHDAGPAVSTDEHYRHARTELAAFAGCGAGHGPVLRQVHGARVVRASDIGPAVAEADAVWEHSGDLVESWIGVRTADCVPILLATVGGEAFAAVHAGWRGTAGRIGPATVEHLARAGYRAGDLVAALGPSIGPCCYPVSEQVADEVATASGGRRGTITGGRTDGVFLDLRAANRRQLIAAGIPAASIHTAPWCTACEADLFFSYRREAGTAGRQFGLIGPAAGRP